MAKGPLPEPHQPGEVRCLALGCNRTFSSPDRCCIRFCPKCRKKRPAETYEPRRASSSVYYQGQKHSIED